MNAFSNLKMAYKLALGFGLCLLLFVAIGILAILRMASMYKITNDLAKNTLTNVEQLAGFDSFARQYRIQEAQHIIAVNDQDKVVYEQEMVQSGNKAQQALDGYARSFDNAEDKSNFESLIGQWSEYVSMNDHLLALSRRNDDKDAAAYFNGPMHAQFLSLSGQLDYMLTWNQRRGDQLARSAEASYQESRLDILAALILSMAFGVIACILITRFIVRNINLCCSLMNRLGTVSIPSFADALESMADGDLTGEIKYTTTAIQVETTEEFGEMAKSFNLTLEAIHRTAHAFERAQAHLGRTIGQVGQSAVTVHETAQMLTSSASQSAEAATQSTAAIQQVATAIQQVARGATVQTEQITAAAASMQQLSASTNEISKGAQQQSLSIQASLQRLEETNTAVRTMAKEAQAAAQVAAQADQTAKEGNEVVQKTVEGMRRIQTAVEASASKIQELGKSSQQIGAIIAVIEEIAEQTNLLALNAAIEAARAGEQGRGFAVVADEVRKLAERSAGATKEISTLISAVQMGTQEVVDAMGQGSTQVERGSELARQAGDALESIQATVRQSRQQFETIEAALTEIQKNAQNVLSEMSNAACVTEESAAAAAEMEAGAVLVEKAMEGIASISEENSAATEEVSASTEEVSAATEEMQAQVEEMAYSAKKLSDLANDLSQMVAQFKIADVDTDQDADARSNNLRLAA